MEIERANFRFNRIINVNDIVNASNLLYMKQTDIDNDENVRGYALGVGDTMVTFQNDSEHRHNERYCYIIFNTLIGEDGATKLLSVKNVIVDEHLIDFTLFACIFTILLRQEDNEYPNRIVVTNVYNERFHGRIEEVANNIANRIFTLYTTFTGQCCKKNVII